MPIIYLAGTRKSERCILHTQLLECCLRNLSCSTQSAEEFGIDGMLWSSEEQRHGWLLAAGATHRSQLSPQQMARNSADSADLSNLCGSQQMTQFSAEGRNLRRLCSSQQLEYICRSEMRYLTKRLLQEGERETGLLPHVLAS